MDDLPYSAACERNRQPILEAIAPWLTAPATVLEIGAGTGQHAEHFAPALPHVCWQTSDRGAYLPGLQARMTACGRDNLPAPLELDVCREPWPCEQIDHGYAANTAHIMSWPEVEAMFAGLARRLRPGGLFLLYGPFHHDGEPTSPSNARFDHSLRRRHPHMGVRDDRALHDLAARCGFVPLADAPLPAGNRLLIWGRRAG